MRTILLSAFAAALTLTASAHEFKVVRPGTLPETVSIKEDANTFKEKFGLNQALEMQSDLAKKNLSLHKVQATSGNSEMVTDPQGTKSRYAMSVNIYLSHMGNAHVGGFGAEVITDGDKFFSRAFTLNFFQQGYSEGEITDDEVVFHSGQYIYDTADGEKAYMYSAYLGEDEDWPELVDTFVLTKDEDGCYRSMPGYYFMVLTEEEAERGVDAATDIICFGTNYIFTPLPADVADNIPPSDAEVSKCQIVANSLSDFGAQTIKDVTVAISGDKIYIGDLTDYLPGSYLMGTIGADNTVTFASHQYIGYHDKGDFPYIYEFDMVNPIYFNGESVYFQEVGSVNMTFDDSHTMLTLEENAGIIVCAYGDINTWDEVYWNMMLGDFKKPLTPLEAADVNCYDGYGTPYIFFEWNPTSVEGIPMIASNLWCEVIINGQPYKFTPELYEGLKATTEKVYYNTTGVDGLNIGDYSTIYLYEYNGRFDDIKTVGIKIGYTCEDETRYSDLIYASGFEPFEDKAFVPTAPTEIVYYKDYFSNFRFRFDGKDIEGNTIPKRLLSVEILLDGEPLIFKDTDYYLNGGEGDDVSILNLEKHTSVITSLQDDVYVITPWAHGDEIPEFTTLTIRPICTGDDTITYGESGEIDLLRAANPANPWDVSYSEDMKQLVFGALPIDTDDNGLAPWNYGYEVYVNDELFVFQAAPYDLESDITLIPYEGFEYNYNFYLTTQNVYDETTWAIVDQKVVMEVDMRKQDTEIQKIGVRAVYTDGEGNTTYSDIINSDGTIGAGVNAIGYDNSEVKWYNMQGIEVIYPEAGAIYLRQEGGKTTKVIVK